MYQDVYQQSIWYIVHTGADMADKTRKTGQRGRVRCSKVRNLLERLQLYEQDVLRFMIHPMVSFINNQGENDIRMTRKYPAAFDPKTALIAFAVGAVICRPVGKTTFQPVRLLPFYSMGNCQISFFE